mmetsp:Transcript_5430/g.15713  ORF Transcript_5430/g.15713 Transcript_5430/m.15713 type:complete len:287 (+) Transcript_5430:2788-3648(+)
MHHRVPDGDICCQHHGGRHSKACGRGGAEGAVHPEGEQPHSERAVQRGLRGPRSGHPGPQGDGGAARPHEGARPLHRPPAAEDPQGEGGEGHQQQGLHRRGEEGLLLPQEQLRHGAAPEAQCRPDGLRRRQHVDSHEVPHGGQRGCANSACVRRTVSLGRGGPERLHHKRHHLRFEGPAREALAARGAGGAPHRPRQPQAPHAAVLPGFESPQPRMTAPAHGQPMRAGVFFPTCFPSGAPRGSRWSSCRGGGFLRGTQAPRPESRHFRGGSGLRGLHRRTRGWMDQ